jgi:hypothetical protein
LFNPHLATSADPGHVAAIQMVARTVRLSALLLLVVFLFPPWVRVAPCPQCESLNRSAGFAPFWAPPEVGRSYVVRVNYTQLAFEVIVAVLGATLLARLPGRDIERR